jgi:hypothetical protein
LNAAVSSETSGDYKKLLLALIGQWPTQIKLLDIITYTNVESFGN